MQNLPLTPGFPQRQLLTTQSSVMDLLAAAYEPAARFYKALTEGDKESEQYRWEADDPVTIKHEVLS